MNSKFKFFLLLIPVLSCTLNAQVKFSLATDFSVLRNFAGKQNFTVAGQSLHAQWHLDQKNSFYTWFTYHGNGKFNNKLSASAKSAATQPQSISFTSNAEMKLRHISIGLKRYLLGSFNNSEKFNLYGAAGFGLMMGKAINNFSIAVDTLLYTVQDNLRNGSGNFKRLTFDLAAGWEYPASYEIYIFSEARIHIPASGYPSNYLLKNDNAPFTASINLGFRILFNNDR